MFLVHYGLLSIGATLILIFLTKIRCWSNAPQGMA